MTLPTRLWVKLSLTKIMVLQRKITLSPVKLLLLKQVGLLQVVPPPLRLKEKPAMGNKEAKSPSVLRQLHLDLPLSQSGKLVNL